MLKKLFFALSLSALYPLSALAQDNADFFQDILISDELKQQEAAQQAQQQLEENRAEAQDAAGALLDAKPKSLKIDMPELPRRSQTTPQPEPQEDVQNLDAAPFGLLWKANIDTIKNIGVILTPVDEKDYVNSFIATGLPKGALDFKSVKLTFGEENELWRIIAVSDFMQDTPSAEKGLRLYNTYSRLLDQKYGNKQEFYTPAMKTIEKTVIVNRKETIQTEQVPYEIGNPEFLSQLQNGSATLYCTFVGNGVGAAITLSVDGDGQSYIVIDYKNLKILQEREQEAVDIL